MQETCNSVLNSKLGFYVNGVRPMKLQFISNRALGYGNDLASYPSRLVLLGTEQSQISLCQGSSLANRNASAGNVTVFRNGSTYANFLDCSIILAPFGAQSISLVFTEVSIVCTLKSRPLRPDWKSLWENGTYKGPCDSCESDYLQVQECSDSSCAFSTVIKRICGNKFVTWTGVSYYPSSGIVSRSGFIKLTFHSDSGIGSLGFSASYQSQPIFEASSQLVPGQDLMSFTFLSSDNFQSIVKPDSDSVFLEILICPLGNPGCNSLESILPAVFFIFSNDFLYRISSQSVFSCPSNKTAAVARFFLTNSEQQAIFRQISCLPCKAGQTKTLAATGTTWMCVSCSKYQYVVNPNLFKCQDCPIGAQCDGSSLQGLLSGSTWMPSNITGEYILKGCPPVVARIIFEFLVRKSLTWCFIGKPSREFDRRCLLGC